MDFAGSAGSYYPGLTSETGIVSAAHGEREGGAEGVGEARQVAVDQLGLERLGGGGHDRAAAGGDDRKSVAERLADAGRRVYQQRFLGGERASDRLRHAPLRHPVGQSG